MTTPSDVAFSPAVKRQQELHGSRDGYARMEEKGGWRTSVDAFLEDFIARSDSFYLATASSQGQPYVQHRGGPPGFLKILGPRTLAFADYAGNRQYISVGNLSENDKAQLFLMDYAQQRRVKIWGRARVSDEAAVLEKVTDTSYGARVERAIVFEIDAWDRNCPQHIRPRPTAEAS